MCECVYMCHREQSMLAVDGFKESSLILLMLSPHCLVVQNCSHDYSQYCRELILRRAFRIRIVPNEVAKVNFYSSFTG